MCVEHHPNSLFQQLGAGYSLFHFGLVFHGRGRDLLQGPFIRPDDERIVGRQDRARRTIPQFFDEHLVGLDFFAEIPMFVNDRAVGFRMNSVPSLQRASIRDSRTGTYDCIAVRSSPAAARATSSAGFSSTS